MPTEAAAKAPAARRHPLQLTADRLNQHIKDYPQLFDTIGLAAVDRIVRVLGAAAENGIETAAPAPVNPGQAFDQRVKS